ncbi:cyclic pyranopterin monophosphate synthase MoaC [Desulfolucanica intricata]|uniref:cyclic pyranopterin monophosphate synthase MoaC n=1 Tax=Desulfolucanica intricata TaxID=1285191 RepID=UPI00082CD308|nr:cyclic pyranopterin monophosphate synthase MoaC [Desulfolucanica intricata]
MPELTHFDARGRARMVDVGGKSDTEREAVARGEIIMQPETLKLIEEGDMSKGDVLGVARVAGIMAAKETGRLIPMAHPIMVTGSGIDFRYRYPDTIEIEARVRTTGKTGVEMEALTAVSVAALTIYDMCKAVDKGMTIQNVRLILKTGGKSGKFEREGEIAWE